MVDEPNTPTGETKAPDAPPKKTKTEAAKKPKSRLPLIFGALALVVFVLFLAFGWHAINSSKEQSRAKAEVQAVSTAKLQPVITYAPPRSGVTVAPVGSYSQDIRLYPGECMLWDDGLQMDARRQHGNETREGPSQVFREDSQTRLVAFKSLTSSPVEVGWTIYPLAHAACEPWQSPKK